jgi:hypothetical protein
VERRFEDRTLLRLFPKTDAVTSLRALAEIGHPTGRHPHGRPDADYLTSSPAGATRVREDAARAAAPALRRRLRTGRGCDGPSSADFALHVGSCVSRSPRARGLASIAYGASIHNPLIYDDRTLLDNAWLAGGRSSVGVPHDYWHGTKHEASDPIGR